MAKANGRSSSSTDLPRLPACPSRACHRVWPCGLGFTMRAMASGRPVVSLRGESPHVTHRLVHGLGAFMLSTSGWGYAICSPLTTGSHRAGIARALACGLAAGPRIPGVAPGSGQHSHAATDRRRPSISKQNRGCRQLLWHETQTGRHDRGLIAYQHASWLLLDARTVSVQRAQQKLLCTGEGWPFSNPECSCGSPKRSGGQGW